MKKKIVTYGIVMIMLLSVLLFTVGAETIEREIQSVQEINDWNDLDGVKDDLDGNYVLRNDLDSGTSGYNELVSTAQGWEPIGMDSFSPFTGTFDGNGFEIIDLYIDRPDTDSSWESVGLFGTVEEDAEITSVGIVDADVTGNWYVGALVGNNRGTVTDSYSTGDVTGESRVGGLVGDNSGTLSNSHTGCTVSGDSQIGGLSGRNTGTLSSSYATGVVSGNENVGGLVGFNWDATVSKSYATGAVNGEEEHIGGLVGHNHGGSSFVSYSYASGNVDGNSHVGGLVGKNDGTISTSYATGTVGGDDYIGGLVGNNDDANVENSYATGTVNGNSQVGGLVGRNTRGGTIKKSYSVGTVSGNSNVGGLVGYDFGFIDDGITYDSFWDTETSGMDTSEGGTGKITAEMKDVATYTDTSTEGLDEPWDFVGNPNDDQGDEEIWDIDAEVNDGYPFLVEEEPEEYTLTIIIEGQGTTDPEEGTHTYIEGEQVTITATPETGWYFLEWDGDQTGTEDEIAVMMDGNLEITAVFEEGDDEGIDLVPSIEITSPSDGFIFNSHTETIQWAAEEGQYPISHYEISIDGGSWKNIGTVNHHTFTNLEEGDHTFTVKVVDSEGNENTASVNFTLDITDEETTGGKISTLVFALIGILVIALVAALVILFVLLRKGKKVEEAPSSEELPQSFEESPQDPDRTTDD